ncbi:MAG: hypothetical protein KDD70_02415 [Bdellovibrionales bacterium]|nr:hypothetical protein [Bdellovibrionales bacterium]
MIEYVPLTALLSLIVFTSLFALGILVDGLFNLTGETIVKAGCNDRAPQSAASTVVTPIHAAGFLTNIQSGGCPNHRAASSVAGGSIQNPNVP